ncbi:hypothetical protein [Pseudomonas luteola]|uniref:Uncharacterized protein n=1 Tax=Pseudomonas luteola TaxID=47886 RepID=A0ABS0MUV8_PSELU|nr:hypothetical protein [Pseudomonas luteola]MBH3440502.1 hypothetical protein [Pseudomonas luteola]
MIFKDGGKLTHIRAENFINEPIDQFVAVSYASGNEPKISITFGRDEMLVNHETFREISPNSNLFRTEVSDNDYMVKRIDLANLTISIETAKRLRDLLNEMIEKNPLTQIVPNMP